MPRTEGYDKPRTPEATPPAIDPANKPKSSQEMKEEGETEGDVLKREKGSSELDTELSRRLADRDKSDGAGEQELDSMRPETLLPPD
jgi:hypothetical protein